MQIFWHLQKKTEVTRVRGVSHNNCTPPPRRFRCLLFLLLRTERRHGSTRVPGHSFLAWRSSWRMVVYIWYMTAAENSISLQLWAVPVRATGTVSKRRAVRPVHHVQNNTFRVTLFQPCWASTLAFGLIGQECMFLCPPGESLQACAKTCVYFACSTNLQIPAYSRTQVSDHDFQIRFEFYNHACIAMQ